MLFPTLYWILTAAALVLSCMGFYNFVYFMSIGYGLAVAGDGLVLAIASLKGGIQPIFLIQCILLIVYGLRLGLFLLIREMKSAAYKKTLQDQTAKPVPLPVKICMWIFCALLYGCQVSPMMYRLANGSAGKGSVLMAIGAVIMAIGIVIEALADKQKSESKKKNPHMVAMDGLYRYSRCPNYFGEVLVWTGVFVSGLNIVKGAQWIIALIGYIAIVYIMISGCKRLEKRQNKNYGDKKEYRDYANSTPIMVPFLPIYHLVKEED